MILFKIGKKIKIKKRRLMKMPKCNAPCETYSRIVGYLRPVQNWNLGKQEEFKERQTFSEKKAMGKV